LINSNSSFNTSTLTSSYLVCEALSLDGTEVKYLSPLPGSGCPTISSAVQMGTVVANNELYMQSLAFIANNPVLHNWKNSTGDFGMGYNYSGTGYTSFQQILLASTTDTEESQTFGLDFRNPSSSIASIASQASSIQLGGISSSFASSISYLTQPVQYPVYHEFFIEDLSFCGVDLFGNYSNNWLVMVDSGSSCLTLPSEMYNAFASWYSNTTAVTNTNQLPALSFKLLGSSESLFIPLSELIVAANAIETEVGAPYVNLQGSTSPSRICVLQGTEIEDNKGNYNTPPPMIVFGALVLQSIYFSADFSQNSVGLANKLSASEVSYYSNVANPSCAKIPSCSGQQSYDIFSNSCEDPSCDAYFFLTIDHSTKQCVYTRQAMGFGLFFITLIILLEVMSYFVIQYTAFNINDQRTNSTFHVDRFTLWIGRYVTSFHDKLITLGSKYQYSAGLARFFPAPPPGGGVLPVVPVNNNPNNGRARVAAVVVAAEQQALHIAPQEPQQGQQRQRRQVPQGVVNV
jgi:hypothetical protein